MFRHISKVWNFDFRHTKLERRSALQLTVVILATLATAALVPVASSFVEPAQTLLDATSGKVTLFGVDTLSAGVAYALIGAMALTMIVSVGYPFWVALFGPDRAKQTPVVWAHTITTLVELAAMNVVLLVISVAASAHHASEGSAMAAGQGIFSQGKRSLAHFIDGIVPTIVVIPAPFSVIAWFLIAGFGYYVLHRLFHTSRLLWLLVHRAHHAPSVLTGLLAPPTVFAFFFTLPMTFVVLVLAKMFPSPVGITPLGELVPSPVFSIVFVLQFLRAATDIASHQTALYDAVYRRPVLRYLFGCFCGGPYHYVHHSSLPHEEMVNLDVWGPFLLWDRIFGTYRAPTAEPPPVGLTKSPTIRLSPFLILFSGYQQLAYELRANKGWLTRARIVFGSVAYHPPVSREFLIVEYPKDRAEPSKAPDAFGVDEAVAAEARRASTPAPAADAPM